MSKKEKIKDRPIVYRYVDYRHFLKDMFQFLKYADNKYFSYRFFAKRAGFRSSSYLKLVLDGKRKIAAKSIDRFAEAFGLNRAETAFFRKLVFLNQAATVEERKFFAEQLLRSQTFRNSHPLTREQFEYFNNWYYVVVREMVGMKDFQEDPEWIAQQLAPKITVMEARKALQELEALGLIQRNAQGKLELRDPVITYNEAIASATAAQYHRNMIRLGSESMERHGREDREIAGETLAFSKESMEQVRQMIQNWRRELIALSLDDKSQNRIFQVNFQMFPLTSDIEEKDNENPPKAS